MQEKPTPLQKEWAKLEKQEAAYLQRKAEKTDSKLNQFLAAKVPENLQKTLDNAFYKAFHLVFEKGTGVIEKTYKRETLQQNYQINEYASQVRGNRKSLKVFSKKASGAGNVNLLLSGVSGVGLGVLGIGIPDIVLFTGLMLKSLYEIALNFGFDYQEENEKRFILLLIRGALAHGEELEKINAELNAYISMGRQCGSSESDGGESDGSESDSGSDFYGGGLSASGLDNSREYALMTKDLDTCIRAAAACLSKELLYMKFLQGIPIVGAVGGAYDAIYMKQIVKYAELKYRRRFYEKQQEVIV